jgi:AraC family transcriptional regulator, arabinose operon regulatory protein
MYQKIDYMDKSTVCRKGSVEVNNQSYYRLASDNGCDMAIDERFLVVNCSGVCVLSEPFTSRNSRRDYYLMYLYQGELEMEIAGRVHDVQAGSLVIYPPGYEYRYTKRGHNELIYYWTHFTGSGAQALLGSCALSTQTIFFAGVCSEIADYFRQLFHNFIYRDGCFEAAATAQLSNICVLLRRRINGNTSLPGSNMTPKIRKSLEYMHRHYSDPIAISSLADIEHLSVSRYCAVFKACTGVSPQSYLINLRLEMAAELMLETDLSLKQIAKSVGYDDQLYFSRLFKLRKGVSPKLYIATSVENIY